MMQKVITSPKHGSFVLQYDEVDQIKVGNHKWTPFKCGKVFYAVRNGKSEGRKGIILLHKEILPCTAEKEIDHEDGDGMNNRRNNLRIVTRSENSMNKGKHIDNTSGFKGVYFHKPMKKWHTEIMKQGVKIHGGFFETPAGAALAYNQLALLHHGEFAKLNKIENVESSGAATALPTA
jgi:hypothetical protein